MSGMEPAVLSALIGAASTTAATGANLLQGQPNPGLAKGQNVQGGLQPLPMQPQPGGMLKGQDFGELFRALDQQEAAKRDALLAASLQGSGIPKKQTRR